MVSESVTKTSIFEGDTTLRPGPPRSFFVGATAFYRGRERRRAFRWLVAIVVRGNTEPVQLWMVCNFICAGLLLVDKPDNPVLAQPHLIGALCLAAGIFGLHGLTFRSLPMQTAFGLFGFFLRTWMAVAWLQRYPAGSTWTSYMISSLACVWFGIRTACRYGAISVQQGTCPKWLRRFIW